ncbi:hypothetical protein [Streptomyces sp. NBC_00083]|uniref:hypothetical protein n=1 Tax=Streptomyces sp. NBC_00083 TaxID=2975647 RepID=UPI00225BE94F|nr:hypothetical protein [Streptomyces sp. NBC_00083]MCX5385093.1 hypothetical protein [Streptomyces sp. NBC_00083]
MSSSSPLPPSPPPAEIRAWRDRNALLADRAQALEALAKGYLGAGRLGLLWLWAALFALGWSLVGAALTSLTDVLTAIVGVLLLLLGVGVMIPAGLAVGFGLRKDRRIRELLHQWAELDHDPVLDRNLARPGLSLAWLVPSVLLCAAGLAVCLVLPATAAPGHDTYALVVYGMGLGLICWLTGLAGVAKAAAYRRWVQRSLAAAGPR